MSANVYEIVTEQIIAALDRGTVPWQQPWNGDGLMARPRNIRGNYYRGINVWLLALQGYSDPRWLTFKQCQANGGRVRKGEKSTIVVFWSIIDDKHNRDEDGNPGKRFFLRYYRVFNVEQCDGLTLPTLPTAAENDISPIDTAEQIVENMQQRPLITHSGDRAYYRPSADTVNMPPMSAFNGSPEYYSTLFHELAHSTGHQSRLKRFDDSESSAFGSESYSREELIAEMTATFLCNEAGFLARTFDNSAAYIASWKRKLTDDPKCVINAAAAAQKSADFILNVKAATAEDHES